MGIGTFWFPKFSIHNVGGLASFHEQPPLVFGIQALFFKLLGSSMYVERFYTFLTMVITAGLIAILWKDINNQDERLKKLAWLPLILWITIPVCFWSYSNNMHENTMGIFTMISVILIYKASQPGKLQLFTLILAGIAVFLATLSKGIPGLFPVTAPLLYWLATKKNTFSKTLLQTGIIVLLPIMIYSILFMIPESRESLSTYLFKRALHRINQVPTVDNRFWIIYRLLTELIPQILIVVVVLLVARTKKTVTELSEQAGRSVFFLLVGLSASAPLMLTLVQKGFYFVPALPFFAIGLSLMIAPAVLQFTSRINTSHSTYNFCVAIALCLFLGAVTFSFLQKGKTSRNSELLHDVYLIGSVVPEHSTVTIPPVMWNDFSLQCYLARYYYISLETMAQERYLIIDNSMNLAIPPGYRKSGISTLQYDLYEQQ
jgi:4-amino-4-deoxy-L-arabinose transferase-like glycosyltransferase